MAAFRYLAVAQFGYRYCYSGRMEHVEIRKETIDPTTHTYKGENNDEQNDSTRNYPIYR